MAKQTACRYCGEMKDNRGLAAHERGCEQNPMNRCTTLGEAQMFDLHSDREICAGGTLTAYGLHSESGLRVVVCRFARVVQPEEDTGEISDDLVTAATGLGFQVLERSTGRVMYG